MDLEDIIRDLIEKTEQEFVESEYCPIGMKIMYLQNKILHIINPFFDKYAQDSSLGNDKLLIALQQNMEMTVDILKAIKEKYKIEEE